MGVRLRSGDQTGKCGMAHEKFSSSEESTHEQIQGENHDYCFFRQPWHCTQRICTSRTELIMPSTRCLGTTSKAGPASPNGHCRRLGAASR